MHIAQIAQWGEDPKYTTAADPQPPKDSQMEQQVTVELVGIHPLVRLRASGKHYTATTTPHIPGVDGVGKTQDGKSVYFSALGLPGAGTLVEKLNLPSHRIIPFPSSIDKVAMTLYMNAAMAAYMALKYRAVSMPPAGKKDSWNLLIMGATGMAGSVAVGIGRAFGAKRIVGVGRSAKKLDGIGLDDTIILSQDDNGRTTDFSSVTAQDDKAVDVVLDFLYGPPATALLEQIKSNHRVQFLQVGSLAGPEIALPANTIRSKDVVMVGSGPGGWSMKQYEETLPEMVDVVGKLTPPREGQVVLKKLEDVEEAWKLKMGDSRLVIQV